MVLVLNLLGSFSLSFFPKLHVSPNFGLLHGYPLTSTASMQPACVHSPSPIATPELPGPHSSLGSACIWQTLNEMKDYKNWLSKKLAGGMCGGERKVWLCFYDSFLSLQGHTVMSAWCGLTPTCVSKSLVFVALPMTSFTGDVLRDRNWITDVIKSPYGGGSGSCHICQMNVWTAVPISMETLTHVRVLPPCAVSPPFPLL